MILQWLCQKYHVARITILLIFKPVTLFHQLNKLDWYQAELKQWLDEIKVNPNAVVLEVACATGLLSEHLLNSGYNVTAIDLSKAMLEVAMSNNSQAHYQVADVTELPFEDNCFDVVIAASLINIIKEKDKAISEMIRVCKAGGVISILVPNQKFGKEHFTALSMKLGVSGFSKASLDRWHNLAPKMDKQYAERLLLGNGLRGVSSKIYLQGMLFSMTGIKMTDEQKSDMDYASGV